LAHSTISNRFPWVEEVEEPAFNNARFGGFREIDNAPVVVNDEADVAALNFPPCGVFKATVTCCQWSSVAFHALVPAPNETYCHLFWPSDTTRIAMHY
jgi:hypothetical protein